jgi:hypothetical protein
VLPAAAALAVLVLPLTPTGTISGKQATGVTFQIKSAIERGSLAKILAESPADKKQADECGLEVACLQRIAELRGADVVIAGTLAPAADGLTLHVVAAGPGVKRDLVRSIHGDDLDERTMDRLARETVDPTQLLGSVFVEGDEGARVFLDDVDLGPLPLREQKNGVVEGDHRLVVKRGDAVIFERTIQVVYAETTLVRAMSSTEEAPPPPRALPIVPIAVGAGGVVLVGAGAVCGVFSLLASMETEARAKEGQLLFPRDEGLVQRGQILALTADALYVGGAALMATGAILFVVSE